jgi:predicted restriction endonuclease
MGRKEWDKLRKEVYAEYGHRCGICGAQGRLNCHERWSYDDETHVQTYRSRWDTGDGWET